MIGINARQRGISLVEIMVALLLSLFLMGGVIQIYLSSKQTYRTQEGNSRLQENGRFAMEILSRQIRMAGYKTSAWDQSETAFPVRFPLRESHPDCRRRRGRNHAFTSFPDSVTIDFREMRTI